MKPRSEPPPSHLIFQSATSEVSKAELVGTSQPDLGELMARSPVRQAGTRRLGLGILVVVSLLGYGIWRAYYGYTNYGVAAASSWSAPWLLGAALVAGLWLFLLVGHLRPRNPGVEVYQHGLRMTTPTRQTLRLGWDEIASLTSESLQRTFLGVPLSQRERLTVHPINQPPIQLQGPSPVWSGVLRQIKAAYFAHLSPLLRAKLQANHWVTFGALAVHRQALQFRGQRFPWTEVQSVEVHSGMLVVQRRTGRPLRIPAAQIPNVELMLDLIHSGVAS